MKEKLKPFTTGHYGVLAKVDTYGSKGGKEEEEETKRDGDGGIGDRDTNTGVLASMYGGTQNVYGPNLPWLQGIRKKYDTTNLCTINDNILPK